jgi:hypothetical protein
MDRQGFAIYWRKLDAADDRFARWWTRKGRSTESKPDPANSRNQSDSSFSVAYADESTQAKKGNS